MERIGYHIFTDSDVEHAKNAKKYQEWLDKKNIKNQSKDFLCHYVL